MHSWRRHCGVLVSLLALNITLYLPLAARAEGSDEVQTYLRSINRLYEELEHGRALEQLARAKPLARSEEDQAALSLFEGLILADLSRKEEASMAFEAALFLRPEAKLPVQVSPKVAQHFEIVRQQVKRELAKQEAERQQLEARRQAEANGQQLEEERQSGAQPSLEERVGAPLTTAAPPVSPNVAVPAPRGEIRPQVLLPATAGCVMLLAGAISFKLAGDTQERLRTVRHELQPRVLNEARLWQGMGYGLTGAGVVGVGIAAGFYVSGMRAEPVALSVGTDGTSAFVSGRW